MVVKVRNSYSTVAEDNRVDWFVQSFKVLSFCSKLCDKLSGQVEELDSIVLRITDNKMAGLVERQSTRLVEFAITFSQFSKFEKKRPFHVQYFDRMVSSVGHKQFSMLLNSVVRFLKNASAAKATQDLAARGKDFNTLVACVGDNKVSFGIN